MHYIEILGAEAPEKYRLAGGGFNICLILIDPTVILIGLVKFLVPRPMQGALMVFRTATVYTLVCVLLFCPYPCLARAVNNCCEKTENECDCQDRDPCCPADSSDSGDNLPVNHDCCSQGGTCLCHGAILEHCANPIIIDAGLVAPLPLGAFLMPGQMFVVDYSLFPERGACHFHSADSGRKVRALIESFLI
jgi:hypothetical protein